MKTIFPRLVAAAFLLIPLLGQGAAVVPFTAVVAAIEWKDVPETEQAAILARIGVRQGDVLSIAARQRIGRELGKKLVFSYRPGAQPGTAILLISGDC